MGIPRSLTAVALVMMALAATACAAAPSSERATQAPAPTATGSLTPTPTETPGIGATAVARVSAMSLRERAASVVMGHIPTTDAAALNAYMTSTGIGGFLLMGANVPADETALRGITTALTPDATLPPLIAIDQEGGDVSRLPWDDFASALTLKDLPAADTETAFAGRGALVARAGIGVNFGIVADVPADAGSFIYRRALGTTPEVSAERVAAAVRGEEGSALSTLKHFPGHGAAPGDSHVGVPSTGMSYDEWLAADALPFRAGIDAGAPLLMFGHLAYTAVDPAPATLSAEWHRIAREELGFAGVSITDDLGMLQSSGLPEYADPAANAVAALAAGNDMVLTVVHSTAETAPRTVDAIVAAVESGALPAARLQEAAERVAELRLTVAAQENALACAECAPGE